MVKQERLRVLEELRKLLLSTDRDDIKVLINHAHRQNGWFTPININNAMAAIATDMLDPMKLRQWISRYDLSTVEEKTVGIIMAGNIPMVGIHDLLCSYMCGHKTLVRASGKDDVLLKGLIDLISEKYPQISKDIQFVDQLKDYDAAIATGGNTAATHFEQYFARVPHIIRKNRNSVAILDGQETTEEIDGLAHDIFEYFGLGCRSISKIYIPHDYNIDRIFSALYPYRDIVNHHKYKNNFDYNHAIYVLTQQEFLTNDFIILKEDTTIASRIACLHYERYNDINIVLDSISDNAEALQCISSRQPLDDRWQHVPLGYCQRPQLMDYADHIDTMQFLINL